MTLSRIQPGQPFDSAKNQANAGRAGTPVKAAIGKFLEYLRAVRNASEHTLRNYQSDLEQFLAYLSPPETPAALVHKIDHRIIREYLGYLHDQRLQKSSIARKLASLRSFFKFCAREGMIRDNPARLVATPKLPKRLPMVLSAEEMNDFLNKVATLEPAEPAAGLHQALRECPGFRAPADRARSRPARASLCLRTARQRADRPECRGYRPQGADAPRSRQGQQGTHHSVRIEGRTGAAALLADS